MLSDIPTRSSMELQTSYAQVSKLCRDNPVIITVDGREDAVLMSCDAFAEQQNYISELEEKLSMYLHVAQAMDDVRSDRTQHADVVFDEICDELGAQPHPKKPTAIGSMAQEELDAELKKGMDSFKSGRVYTPDEVMKELNER